MTGAKGVRQTQGGRGTVARKGPEEMARCWRRGVDAAAAVAMRRQVLGEGCRRAGQASNRDWADSGGRGATWVCVVETEARRLSGADGLRQRTGVGELVGVRLAVRAGSGSTLEVKFTQLSGGWGEQTRRQNGVQARKLEGEGDSSEAFECCEVERGQDWGETNTCRSSSATNNADFDGVRLFRGTKRVLPAWVNSCLLHVRQSLGRAGRGATGERSSAGSSEGRCRRCESARARGGDARPREERRRRNDGRGSVKGWSRDLGTLGGVEGCRLVGMATGAENLCGPKRVRQSSGRGQVAGAGERLTRGGRPCGGASRAEDATRTLAALAGQRARTGRWGGGSGVCGEASGG
ncbi:uncharacterized protein A4U43_C05F7610 [Asparagus officinalis]|uniref:Uncharacterized protein n=1 Tax=Asparagus officinalis TaxID=4686 RepID=A0A5P1EQA7_ASPOF|nr:uncharacterized protein A4U43_C05F7610 [Asparagus officinalis]